MTEPGAASEPPSVPALAVVGELNVDLLLEEVNALPALEEERRAEHMTLTLGSSSAILAANAAALGLHVGFVGRIGTDDFGRVVSKALHARGVDVGQLIDTPEAQTGLTAIYTHAGQRGMITYPGAMEHLTLSDMPWDYLKQARHLHLSSYYLQRGLRPDCAQLFQRAREAGLSTSFDTNWDPDEEWGRREVQEVLQHVDVFLPNDEEARRISGQDDLMKALDRLTEAGNAVVVTRGAEGAIARGKNGATVRFPAIPPPGRVVDAVGAGDSFNAGFLTAYLTGASLEACVRHGLLSGAFSTQAAGGTAAFDDARAFEEFERAHLSSEGAAEEVLAGER